MYQTVRVAPAAWDGSSVWDLPIDSMAQAPTIEQMQQIEKAKAAKVSSLCVWSRDAHWLFCRRCLFIYWLLI